VGISSRVDDDDHRRSRGGPPDIEQDRLGAVGVEEEAAGLGDGLPGRRQGPAVGREPGPALSTGAAGSGEACGGRVGEVDHALDERAPPRPLRWRTRPAVRLPGRRRGHACSTGAGRRPFPGLASAAWPRRAGARQGLPIHRASARWTARRAPSPRAGAPPAGCTTSAVARPRASAAQAAYGVRTGAGPAGAGAGGGAPAGTSARRASPPASSRSGARKAAKPRGVAPKRSGRWDVPEFLEAHSRRRQPDRRRSRMASHQRASVG
jgi:hypothetical protein